MRLDGIKTLSFSGIDGAGKSTQIETLCYFLEGLGFRCKMLTFWSDVVALPRLRERLISHFFKGGQGVGTPGKPILRCDKNIASWYMTAARMFLYLLDAISLRTVFRNIIGSNYDFIIFDRYLYDELANLPLGDPSIRFFVRLLVKVTPRPDAAIVLDAEPEAAASRKPEYPLEFVRRNRNAYLLLSPMVRATVIPPLPKGEAARMIQEVVINKCLPNHELVGRIGVGEWTVVERLF